MVSLDQYGVQHIFPLKPNGTFLHLGTRAPNQSPHFFIERNTRAHERRTGAFKYWRLGSHPLNYASGGSGYTTRLHLYASGGSQQYTWRNQKHGFLSSNKDVRNQEFTVYARSGKFKDPRRASFSLKIRGGKHSGDWASCTQMGFGPGGKGFRSEVTFAKELTHPKYDTIRLTPRCAANLIEGAWYGLKVVSYSVGTAASKVVKNRLYIDTDPINFTTGKLKNNWQLLAEYVDVPGKSTGHYSKLVDWGGWQTTFRTDGLEYVDFALVSVVEISPP